MPFQSCTRQRTFRVFDSLFDATNISCKIITNNGNALIESGFKDIWNTFQKFNIENEILSDIQAGKNTLPFSGRTN